MKKYISPVCEPECISAKDIIATSGLEYREVTSVQEGNMDNGTFLDVISW